MKLAILAVKLAILAVCTCTTPPNQPCEPVDPGYSVSDAMKMLDAASGSQARPSTFTGCLLLIDSPSCGGYDGFIVVGGGSLVSTHDEPHDVEVQINGTSRHTTLFGGTWRACQLAPGTYRISMCSNTGPVTCVANVKAGEVTPLTVRSPQDPP